MQEPKILTDGRTPEEWVEIFAERDIKISTRKLRRMARETGQCLALGGQIMLLPIHIDEIWKHAKRHVNSADVEKSVGSVGGSRTNMIR